MVAMRAANEPHGGGGGTVARHRCMIAVACDACASDIRLPRGIVWSVLSTAGVDQRLPALVLAVRQAAHCCYIFSGGCEVW